MARSSTLLRVKPMSHSSLIVTHGIYHESSLNVRENWRKLSLHGCYVSRIDMWENAIFKLPGRRYFNAKSQRPVTFQTISCHHVCSVEQIPLFHHIPALSTQKHGLKEPAALRKQSPYPILLYLESSAVARYAHARHTWGYKRW